MDSTLFFVLIGLSLVLPKNDPRPRPSVSAVQFKPTGS